MEIYVWKKMHKPFMYEEQHRYNDKISRQFFPCIRNAVMLLAPYKRYCHHGAVANKSSPRTGYKAKVRYKSIIDKNSDGCAQ